MFPRQVQNLINELSKLPDIGPRAATRLVFYLLSRDQFELNNLSNLIQNIKKNSCLCSQCFNVTDNNNSLCYVCRDKNRQQGIICIVENLLNIIPIEKTKQYNGLYHVLGGLISPVNGKGPEHIKIQELINRIKKDQNIIEIILALSPTTEGDTTALYIERLLKDYPIKISRLARGLSTGSDMEYVDENTLTNALRNRK